MFRSQVEKTSGKNWIRYLEAGWFQGITNLTGSFLISDACYRQPFQK